jgi:glyoxylase-like metal-dependent hydrolase (beta-lactamase superfamily II)
VRALALHPDVLLVAGAVLGVNCVVVRGGVETRPRELRESREAPVVEDTGAETFVIDSPVLPDELDALPTLLEQARFPTPSGLLATHGDWDHLLARLAFPAVALGCSEDTAERLRAHPGAAQRALRSFDEGLLIDRPRPLSLGAVQGLPVPGRCDIGDRELELHPAGGHTADGMAILMGWAGVLVVGDYLSPVEIPCFSDGGDPDAYRETLERLRALTGRADHVVPGHGPVVDCARALEILEEDLDYLRELRERGSEANLPPARRGAEQQRLHAKNLAALGIDGS